VAGFHGNDEYSPFIFSFFISLTKLIGALLFQFGIEEEAVFFLFQKATRHGLRSAFTRGSIRGWIYLEATMTNDLVLLLSLAPGIIRTKAGIIKHHIDFEDWTKTLSVRDAETETAVGQWVRVCKGPYKGDTGFVSALENWGGVTLLLVPHVQLPSDPSSKRKRSCLLPEPKLFDPTAIGSAHKTIKHGDGVYLFKGSTFEHGLLLKQFDLHSISSTSVHMSSYIFSLFQKSHHPSLRRAMFPRPAEWIFDENERVTFNSSGKRGVIKVSGPYTAEVEYSNGEGIESVPWHDLCKDVVVGDFVVVAAGPHQGRMGWVDNFQQGVISILEKVADESVGYQDAVNVGKMHVDVRPL
jgi:hypothetical protein